MSVTTAAADQSQRVAAIEQAFEKEWIPRELRHSFVSLLSDSGVPLGQISRLVGHNGTGVTELITAMDDLFPTDRDT